MVRNTMLWYRDITTTVMLTCAAVRGRAEQVVDAVGVQHERRVRYVVLARGLGQRQALLEHGQYGLGHGLGPPRLERTALSEPQVVHQALVGVPALLPHRLQLVLVTVGCKNTGTHTRGVQLTLRK